MIDIVRNAFITNTLPNGSNFNGIAEKAPDSKICVHIYPNPANTMVNIRVEGSLSQPMTMRLINFNGVVVKSMEVNAGINLVRFDISGLPDGIYLFCLQSKDQVITKKLSIIK